MLANFLAAKKSKLVFRGLPLDFTEIDVYHLHGQEAHNIQTVYLERSIVLGYDYLEATVIYNNKKAASKLFPLLSPEVAKLYRIDLHKKIDKTDDSNSLIEKIVSDNLELSLRTLKDYRIRNSKSISASKQWESIEERILEKLLKVWLAQQQNMHQSEQDAIFEEMILQENKEILSFLEEKVEAPSVDCQTLDQAAREPFAIQL